MAMVMSVGSRNDGQTGFEFDDAPAPTGSCDKNLWYYMDVNIQSTGAKEVKELILSDETVSEDCGTACMECKKA